jgi:hypothetical protein
MAGIRLGSAESARAFKGIICDDISEFEGPCSGVTCARAGAHGAPSRRATLDTNRALLKTALNGFTTVAQVANQDITAGW